MQEQFKLLFKTFIIFSIISENIAVSNVIYNF